MNKFPILAYSKISIEYARMGYFSREAATMGLIILGLISIFLCIKWGNLKNWRAFYPTILFYIAADFSHQLLTSKKDLWRVYGFWNDAFADIFICLIIAPSVVILYLSNYPKNILRQIRYILTYISVLSVIEYIAHEQKSIVYYNGWNFAWTVMLYISAIILLRLHYKHPLWACSLLLILLMIVMFYFKISLINL